MFSLHEPGKEEGTLTQSAYYSKISIKLDEKHYTDEHHIQQMTDDQFYCLVYKGDNFLVDKNGKYRRLLHREIEGGIVEVFKEPIEEGNKMADTYRKMLQAKGAEKIQEGWKLKVGDDTDNGIITLVDKLRLGRVWINPPSLYTENYWNKYKLLWLPSIEDWAEILKTTEWELGHAVEKSGKLNYFVVLNGTFPMFHGDTPQIALFHAAQHELHGLKWNGEEWI